MRQPFAYLTVILSLLLLPGLVNAQPWFGWAPPGKQVEVTNFPAVQSVEVTNPTTEVSVSNLPAVQDVNVVGGSGGSCEAKPFQLVGFTPTSSTGNLAGPFGANAACAAVFPGSRMCLDSEAQRTLDPPTGRPATAWLNKKSNTYNASQAVGGVVFGCGQWVDARSGASGPTIREDGVVTTQGCEIARPIACCAPVAE